MESEIKDIVEGILLVASALFPIVNPIGSAPIFLAVTSDLSIAARRRLSLQVAINCFILMLASVYIGVYVLEFFDLSVHVVQVGGGLVLTAIGWSMLNQRPSADEATAAAALDKRSADSRAFYPLTLPITVGPGSISVAITIGANHTQYTHSAWVNWLVPLLGVTLVAASILVSYRYADTVLRWLGDTGTIVFLRLSAFIVLCLGVQITWNGASALVTRLVATLH
jgi:multiple antibiotic resistance protein